MAVLPDARTATRQEFDAMKHWVWTGRSNATGWAALPGQAARFSSASTSCCARPAGGSAGIAARLDRRWRYRFASRRMSRFCRSPAGIRDRHKVRLGSGHTPRFRVLGIRHQTGSGVYRRRAALAVASAVMKQVAINLGYGGACLKAQHSPEF